MSELEESTFFRFVSPKKITASVYYLSDGKAFQTPEILNKSALKNIPYGNRLKMVCEVTGWYEINWYKNGTEQPKKKEDTGYTRKKMHISTAELEIRRFTDDDEGLYTCEAKREDVRWTAKNEIRLGLGGFWRLKPRIRKLLPKFETAGKNVTIVCESNGSVTMIWRKRGRNLTVTGMSKRDFNVTSRLLEIQHFSKQDEGIYECFVSKRHWNHTTKINVTMKGKLCNHS